MLERHKGYNADSYRKEFIGWIHYIRTLMGERDPRKHTIFTKLVSGPPENGVEQLTAAALADIYLHVTDLLRNGTPDVESALEKTAKELRQKPLVVARGWQAVQCLRSWVSDQLSTLQV